MADATNKKPVVWVEDRDLGGDRNNRCAVARALNPDFKLTNFDDDVKEWPDIIISGSGGGAVKLASSGKTFTVCMRPPDYEYTGGALLNHVDFNIAFTHQGVPPDAITHVYDTVPTRVNDETLKQGLRDADSGLRAATKQKPIYLLMVGGGGSTGMADTLERCKQQIAKTGGILLVTTSSKTTHLTVNEVLKPALKDVPHYLYDFDPKKKENPYLSMLALADKIIVPTNSMSSIADALATGKPTYGYMPFHVENCQSSLQDQLLTAQMPPSSAAYIRLLAEKGALRPMNRFSEDTRNEPLRPINSADQIAADIMAALAKKRSSPPTAPTDAKTHDGKGVAPPPIREVE